MFSFGDLIQFGVFVLMLIALVADLVAKKK